MKMWSGRFSKELDAGVNDFNSSISFDYVMFREDIAGSIAHATMLAKCGVISAPDAGAIVQGLQGIVTDLESGKVAFDPAAEDIHMFVEQLLTERVGEPGKRLHTARSRNDQVALDLRMYLKKQVVLLFNETGGLIAALIAKAEQNLETVMPGYTHLQVAQPVTLAHHLMAYAQMLARDLERLCDCYRRIDVMPLGSGALAATTHPLDRQLVADLLGFAAITHNSMDGVSDRDYCVELGCCLSLIMTHLSRLSEEIVLWCSSEFRFVELDDAFATGSSIMPQKKNPDITELVRGKTGRVNGDLMTLLTMLKGLPLAYNKDLQEDKQAIFDAVDTTLLCLATFTPMLQTMTVLPENMRTAAARGFINATDCADYLAKKGIPFREAYYITGQIVLDCIKRGCTLETLPLSVYKTYHEQFGEDLFEAIDLMTCVRQRKITGGPAPDAVQAQIAELQGRISQLDTQKPF